MDKIAADKGLQLVTELEPSMPSTIIGDSQRLQQIMVNLANNAVKFTEEGGIFVRIFNFDEQNWRIQVTDTGPGIPHKAKEYIFESFRQVEGASTREHGGVGLGLTIVKQLVELMHGSIEVTSGLGKGSIFTVTLPLILNTGTSTQPVLKPQE
jgi:signal transduction histidine kinase